MAVNGAAAMPEAFVGTVMVAVPLLNVPDAPVAGAVKTTFVPDNGLPDPSVTVTASALPKAVITGADCGVVAGFAAIDPAVLVREKVTGVKPITAAVTL